MIDSSTSLIEMFSWLAEDAFYDWDSCLDVGYSQHIIILAELAVLEPQRVLRGSWGQIQAVEPEQHNIKLLTEHLPELWLTGAAFRGWDSWCSSRDDLPTWCLPHVIVTAKTMYVCRRSSNEWMKLPRADARYNTGGWLMVMWQGSWHWGCSF